MSDSTLIFGLIGFAAILMASNKVRFDIVALLVVIALILTGVLTVEQALAGFGTPVVILVAGLLVIGEMLARTGVANAVGELILTKGRGSETRSLALIMIGAAVLGAVMSSTAVVAIFIPIIMRIASEAGVDRSRLLLPMSYAALISGMLTLIATPPNIVVHEELKEEGYEGFGFFGFTIIGLVVLVVAIAYVLILGRRLLHNKAEGAALEYTDQEPPQSPANNVPAGRRMRIAIIILVAMVALAILDVVPLIVAVLLAVLAAIFTRCLTMEDAYRSIHWSSIVLIAGMLPLADALKITGGTDMIVDTLLYLAGDAGPNAMLSILFFLTAGLGLVLSNTASAVLVAPIAIYAAQALGVSPYPFAVAVLIAASAAYSTPVSTPVTTLVVDPGKYRFMDFVKVGVPLLILTYVVTLVIAPMAFPY